MRIKSICDCYSTPFQSCFALHRHIKSGCNANKRVAIVEAGLDLLFARLILCSMAKLLAPDSDPMFRDCNYVISIITFDPLVFLAISDPDTSVCLDTVYGVTLVDKTWLAKKYSS